MPSSIGSVASSMKKSLECSTKPRPVSTGPPFSTFMVSAVSGSLIWSAFLMMSSCTSRSGKVDAARRAIDDDAHRALGRMRAEIDHRTCEARIFHHRHRDQQLAVEITWPVISRRTASAALRRRSLPALYAFRIHPQRTLMSVIHPDIGCPFCQSSFAPISIITSNSMVCASELPVKTLMTVTVPLYASHSALPAALLALCAFSSLRTAQDASPWQQGRPRRGPAARGIAQRRGAARRHRVSARAGLENLLADPGRFRRAAAF